MTGEIHLSAPRELRYRLVYLVRTLLFSLPCLAAFGQISEGTIRDLVIHPASPATIQVLVDGQWVQSNDGGQTWSSAAREMPPDLAGITPDPTAPEIVYVFDRSGAVFRSEDGGFSWQPASFGLEAPALRLHVDPGDPATLFAETPRGIFRSRNQGDGWHPYLPQAFSALAFDPADPARQFVLQCLAVSMPCTSARSLFSEDFGETWKTIGTLALLGRPTPEQREALTKILEASSAQPILGLWADPYTEGRLYAATPLGLWVGERGGAHWRRSGPAVAIHSLALQKGEPPEIYAATDRGLLASLDGGVTWRFDETLNRSISIATVAVGPASGRIWVAAGTQIWSRLNPAHPWEATSYGRPLATTPSQAGRGIAPSPKRRATSLARPEADPTQGLHLDHHVTALAIDPQHSHVIFAGGARGLFRSRDGGNTWAPVLTGGAASDIHSLAIDPSGSHRVWAGTHGDGLYHSNDGGDSWRKAESFPGRAVQRLVIDPERPKRLFAVSIDQGLSASFDGGQSWHGIRDRPTVWRGDLQDLSLDPEDPRALSVVTWAGIFRGRVHGLDTKGPITGLSSGTPWTYARAEPSGSRIRAVLETPGSPGFLYLGTHHGLLVSRDEDRARWSPVGPDVAVSDLTLAPSESGRLAAATSRGVLLLTGEEPEVKLLSIGPVFSVAFDPADARTLFAGTDRGEVRRSFDGGDTWQTTLLPSPLGSAPEPGAVLSPDWTPNSKPAEQRRQVRRSPPEANRLRLLLAAEWAGRGDVQEGDGERLRRMITRLQQEQADFLRRGGLVDLEFGPRDRWLAASFRYDDGRRHRAEIRLYLSDNLFFPSDAESPSAPSEAWKVRHNPMLEPIHQMPARVLPEAWTILAWHPKGHFVVTRGEGDRALLWWLDEPALEDRRPPRLHLAADHRLDHAAFSPDGHWLALAGRRPKGPAEVSLWNLSGAEPRKVELETGAPILDFLHFSPNGRWLLGFESRGHIRAWAMTQDAPAEAITWSIFEPPGPFTKALAAEEGGRWVVGSRARSGESRLATFSLGPDGPRDLRPLATGPHGFPALDSRGRWLAAQGVRPEDSTLLLDLDAPQPGAAALDLGKGVQVGGFTTNGETLVLRTRDSLEVLELAVRPRARSFPIRRYARQDARWTGQRTGLLETTEHGFRWWRWTTPQVRSDDLRAPATPGPLRVAVNGTNSRFIVAGRSGIGRHQLGPLFSESTAIRLGRFDTLGTGPDPLDSRAAAGPLANLAPLPEAATLRELLDRACRVADRPLTPAEWDRAFPGAAYDPVCVAPRRSKRATIGS